MTVLQKGKIFMGPPHPNLSGRNAYVQPHGMGWLVINGTFSTNRLYHTISVPQVDSIDPKEPDISW